MTRTAPPSLAQPHRNVIMVGMVAIALALAACGSAQSQATPNASVPSLIASSSPSTTSVANVYGKLSVVFAHTTKDSVLPREPISYWLAVRQSGTSDEPFASPVGRDGTFALTLRPGTTYEVSHLGAKAADLAPDTVGLGFNVNDDRLLLRVPATGCVYGGEVTVYYGRLPAVPKAEQDKLVEQAGKNNNEATAYIYLPTGGLVLAGASISMPDQALRPAAAQSCVAQKFTFTPHS